jgi:hypothetical protein
MHQDYIFMFVKIVNLNYLERKYNYRVHEGGKDRGILTPTYATCTQASFTQKLRL